MRRFYRYALPYWKLVAVTMVATVIYALMTANAAALVGPAIRAIELRQDKNQPQAATPVSQTDVGDTEEARTMAGQPANREDVAGLVLPRAEPSAHRLRPGRRGGPLMLISGFVNDYLQG